MSQVLVDTLVLGSSSFSSPRVTRSMEPLENPVTIKLFSFSSTLLCVFKKFLLFSVSTLDYCSIQLYFFFPCPKLAKLIHFWGILLITVPSDLTLSDLFWKGQKSFLDSPIQIYIEI